MALAQILPRRGTSAQWIASNPVLANGEIGYDSTLKRMKIGDGNTVWSGLQWATTDAATISKLADVADQIKGATGANDAVMAATAADESSAFRQTLKATIAPVAVGRSAKDFGIGPTRTESQNRAGFLDAKEWAMESKANQSRTLVLPPQNDGAAVYLDQHIRLDVPGLRIVGFGADSRVRTVTKPEPAFLVTSPVQIENVMFEGLPNRAIPNGTFGRRENWDAINYSGVLLLHGSDGSVIRDVYAKNIACAVAAWGWDEDEKRYAGNIQGLDISNIHAKNVWVGVFWREVDFLSLHDVFVEDYAPPGDIFNGDTAAPPHAVYGTSSSSLTVARPMYGNIISRIRARGGRFGSAVSFKHMVGAQISDIVARDCEGVMDVNTMRDSTISGVSGIGDVGGRAGVDELSGSLNVRLSENTRISDVVIRQQEAATSRLLFMAADNTDDVIVDKFTGRSNYPTTAVQELALVRGGRLISPDVKHNGTGAIGRGIRVDQGTVRVESPRVSGVARPLFVDAGATLNVRYDPADLASSNANGQPKIYAGAGAVLVSPRPAERAGLLAWGEPGCFGLDDGTWTHVASGHPVTRLTGNTWRLNQSAAGAISGWARTETATANAITYVDAGAANAEVACLTRSNGSSEVHGLALRVLDASNYLTVELRSTGVFLCSVIGGAKTDIASHLFTRTDQRIYSLRATMFAGSVSVWVDGAERISNQSIGSAQTTIGTQTKHGLYHHSSATAHSLLQSIRSLS